MRNALLSAATLLVVAPALPAQESTPVPSDTATALIIEPDRTLRFTTDEGTWISLDVSPEGDRIVFDLLGDLYVLPMAGGTARRLTSGMSFDAMPRWSPSGEQIAFVSDRDGSDNMWLIAPDGTGLRKITGEVDNALSSPEWTPDGEYLVARRFGPYPSAENYLTNVPLWMYHVNGGGGTKIFPPDDARRSTNTGAAFSPDGGTLYVASHAGGYAGEELGRYQVLAYDRATGEERALTAGSGGGLRPVASSDGRWLVYATRTGAQTALRIRDLRTHEDRWLVGEVQRDDQEGYAPNDVFPGYAFTPDSRAVVFYGGGRIWRVDIDTGDVTPIPFSVDVELEMGPRHSVPLRAEDGPLSITQLLSPSRSPAGDAVAFSAVGQLWRAPLTDGVAGSPELLVEETDRAYFPTHSPDGQWIAYATWSDADGGHVWKVRANGSGAPVRLTVEAASVRSPIWTPNGDRLVYWWSPRAAGLGAGPVATLGELRMVESSGGPSTRVVTSGTPATHVSDARVFFTEVVPGDAENRFGFNADQTTALVSVAYDGTDKRAHVKVTSGRAGSVSLIPSPDLRSLLVLDRDDLYALPLTAAGAEGLAVNLGSPSVPLRRITVEGTNYAGWSDAGETIEWSFANHSYRAPLDSVMAHAERERWAVDHTEIQLEVPRARPSGDIVFRGGRLITMNGDEVIERGDIHIRDNRIVAVGTGLTVPDGAEVVDASGATIMPGIVDVHAHPKTGSEVAPDQEWSIAANLAYGVTTTRNPSGSRWNVAWGELVETGNMVGSRIYATGFPLTSNNTPVKSYEDALRTVRRYKQQGVHSIKQYLQPRRIQRQWILEAAKAEGINATNEGAADLKMDISMAIDGYGAMEHSIGQVPLYKDVVTVFADARIAYTPTLVVAYGGPAGDTYWRARADLDKDPKTAFFTPSEILNRQARRRRLVVAEDYNFSDIARGVRDIVRAGGVAGLGSHGQQDGIAAHWELWMLQSGDMSEMEALRIATIMGAESIGYGADLGSLEPGKLADLTVLNSNPLDDIQNSADIRLVMKNGELYDAASLDRIWPSPRAFPMPYWVREREALEALRGPGG